MTTKPDYESLFRASPYPSLVLDTTLTILDANDAYLKVVGRPAQELLGRSHFDAFPENLADLSSTRNSTQVKSSMERAIASGKPDITPVLRYAIPVGNSDSAKFEDRYWNAVHTPVFGNNGEVTIVVHNPIDVTALYVFNQDSKGDSEGPHVSEEFSADALNRAQLHEAMTRVLKDERSHLRNLFNQSPGFVAVTMGPTHVFEMVNNAYENLVGRCELLGKPALEALPELFDQRLKAGLDSAYQTGKPWVGHGIKVHICSKDDRLLIERYIDLLYQPFYGSDDKVIGVFTQGHDVTDAYKARTAEREIEERWKLAMEASGSGIWEWNPRTNNVVVSPEWRDIVGYSANDLVGTFADMEHRLVHPDDLPQVRADIEAHLTGRTQKLSSSYRVRHKNASWVWILTRGAVIERDNNGNPLRLIGTTTDISRLKHIEEELRIERDRSQAIFDTMTEGFVLIDRHWTVLYMNAEGLRLSRRSASQTIGHHHWEVWSELVDSDPERLYRRVMITRQPETMEFQFTYLDGNTAWLELRAYPVMDTGMAVLIRDVSDRREAEERLHDADRRKDEFLAMLAHELRNPLAPIGAAAELLQLVKLDDARVKQTSKVIARQVSHMTGLIDDLLDVSRVTRGLIEPDKVTLDMQQVVYEAVEQVSPLIRTRSHELTIRQSPHPAIVCADKKRLVQVVSNILNNAAKYTPEGGHLTLCTAVQDSQVLIEVIDDGIGMTLEMTKHAFDLFAQAERTSDRSSGGLGLGLALVKSMIELHGGSVTCKSKGLGHGSTFSIRLPLLMEKISRSSESLQETGLQPASDTSLRILVVDDNVDAAEMLELFLGALGHKVLVEHGPYEALERATLEQPQVYLLDIGLPEIDGNELARRLRAQPQNHAAILIAITGYGQESDRLNALSAGFDYHLVKPVDTRKLVDILSNINVP
jgi:PAS domain S-box-containing protein